MAMRPVKIINQKIIEEALLSAFEKWAEEDINEAHWNDQFLGEKWKYNGVTERANGETVTSPRDIYDLGALYKSGQESFTFSMDTNGAEANWHWDATNRSGQEYAWYVHEGLGTNATPRRFTDDISTPSSFWRKAPGKAFKLQVQEALDGINAN